MDTLPREEIRIGLVADAMRRRWRTVVAIALAFFAVVGLLALLLPASYSSTSDVLLNPTPGNALTVDSARSGDQINVAMQTEAGLVKSPAVADLVSVTVGATVKAGDSDLDITVPSNTQIVRVTYAADTPERATRYADAFAKGLLQYRSDQARSTVQGQLDQLKRQSDTASAGLAKAAKVASAASPSAEAVAQVQLYTNRLATLQDQIGTLEATPVAPGSVITPATVPRSRDGISPLLLALAGLFVGLAVGVATAIWRERTDDRIRARAEVSVAGVPVLGVVPAAISGGSGLIGPGDSHLADAYRAVRAGVLATAAPPAVIAIAALDEGLDAAAHRVAVNIASSIAVTHHDVVLVDATLGTGDIAQMVGATSGRGLADALREELDLVPTVAVDGGYSVVPEGASPLNARELLASAHFRHVIDELATRHDFVIVAGPSANLAESSEVALAATGLVVVTAERRSEEGTVSRLVRRADQLGVSVLGMVAVEYAKDDVEASPARPGPGYGDVTASRPAVERDDTAAAG